MQSNITTLVSGLRCKYQGFNNFVQKLEIYILVKGPVYWRILVEENQYLNLTRKLSIIRSIVFIVSSSSVHYSNIGMQLYNQQYLSLAVMQKCFINPKEIVIRKFRRNSNQTKPNNIQIPKMKRKLLFEIEVCLNY